MTVDVSSAEVVEEDHEVPNVVQFFVTFLMIFDQYFLPDVLIHRRRQWSGLLK